LLEENLSVIEAGIARAAGDHDARIIMFPEFGLTGFADVAGPEWVNASITFPGPQSDRLAAAARKAGAYVLVQAAERHDAFPVRYFLSAAIYTPEGELGLVHRKSYTHSLRTSPADVAEKFCAVFGPGAWLPVLRTPIGNMAVTIAAEVHWPEVTRAMALKGAEIFLNPIANLAGVDYLSREGAQFVRPVRAFENLAYLAMTNVLEGEQRPALYDFRGATVPARFVDEELTISTVDIEALRAERARAGANLLAQIQPRLCPDLSARELWPENHLPDRAAESYEVALATEREIWHKLCQQGVGVLPAGDA
jgi:predicted amidohydrolase